MKFICTLLTVDDIEKSKAFYIDVLDQKVKFDFGENLTFVGDFAIHKKTHYRGLLGDGIEVSRGRNDVELYFEYDDVDAAEKNLEKKGVVFVHRSREQPWGQKVLRIYDPDGYIVEVGESLAHLSYRLSRKGMKEAGIAQKIGITEEIVAQGISQFEDQ
ncbi:MAG: VOC family protein [Spirochaetota bacterium]